MRPFLLPIFFYAGQVNAAAESTSLSSSQLVAVAEMRALLVWILLQLRIISRDQVPARRPPPWLQWAGARLRVRISVRVLMSTARSFGDMLQTRGRPPRCLRSSCN